jgi:hypothetical protein
MSARGSWSKRRAQPPEYERAAPGGALAPAGLMNALHRCDRCRAQAYVRVLLNSRRDLLFCAHHYREYAPALARVAIGIQDETDRLVRGDRSGARS